MHVSFAVRRQLIASIKSSKNEKEKRDCFWVSLIFKIKPL